MHTWEMELCTWGLSVTCGDKGEREFMWIGNKLSQIPQGKSWSFTCDGTWWAISLTLFWPMSFLALVFPVFCAVAWGDGVRLSSWVGAWLPAMANPAQLSISKCKLAGDWQEMLWVSSADHVVLGLQFRGEAAALCAQVHIAALQFQSVTCVPHPTSGIHLLVKRELVNVCSQVHLYWEVWL